MRLSTTRRGIILMAGALFALLALAACGGGDDSAAGDFDQLAAQSSIGSAADSLSVIEDKAAANAPEASNESPSGDDGGSGGQFASSTRKIIFTSSIDLEVENVTRSFQSVSRLAISVGGFVESSELTRRTDNEGEAYEVATITIRVPSSQYGDVLEQLRSLNGGTVTHEDSRSAEVTEEYADLTSRIRNLERTENRYLALLEEAETIQDILIVTDRLDGVRLQIEQLQGRVNLLDDLVDLATIHVALDPVTVPVLALVEETDGNSGPLGALADAWDVSLVAAGGVLIVLAYAAVAALWIGPIAIIALVVLRRLGRASTGAA